MRHLDGKTGDFLAAYSEIQFLFRFIFAKRHFAYVMIVVVMMPFMLASCSSKKSPVIPKNTVIGEKCSDPRSFKLYVSNQSTSLRNVDITAQIDGVLIVNEYFNVWTQHNWKLFEFMLCPGQHSLYAKTQKGEADLMQNIQIDKSIDYGVLNYWFYDKNADAEPIPRSFIFEVSPGEFGPA